MREKYILNFGDSWAACGRIDTDNLYATHLGKMLGDYKMLDYAKSSTSAQRLILQFREFINNDYKDTSKYVAVFFITAQERQLIFDEDKNPIEMHPHKDAFENYYRHIYTDRLGEFNLNTTILTLQSMCRYYKINDLYILGWQYPTLWPEVDRKKFYKEAKVNCMNMLGGTNKSSLNSIGNENFIPNDGHPSDQGHKKIADELCRWMTLTNYRL